MNKQFNFDLYKRTNILSQEEMENLIDENLFKKILITDPHPEFQAYVVAHDGISEGVDENYRKSFLKYAKNAILKIYDNIKLETSAFFNHLKPGDSTEREEIGKIVGKTIKNTDTSVQTIAIIYLKPGWRDKNLEVASLEMSVVIEDDKVVGIKNVDAVALSDKSEKPGFENARLVQQLNYFISKHEEETIMNLEDVKKFVKENAVKPNQLFDIDEILNDRDVDARVKKELQTKHEHARRLEDKIKSLEEDRSKEYESLKEKTKEYQTIAWKYKGESYLSDKLKEVDEKDEVKNLLKNKIISSTLKDVVSFESESDIFKAIDNKFNEHYEEINTIKSIFTEKHEDKNEEPKIPRKFPKPEKKEDKKEDNSARTQIEDKVKELLEV